MPSDQHVLIRDRDSLLPSCYLTKNDLVTIYRRLQEKTQDAAELEVRDWVKPDDDSGQFDDTVNWVKGLFVVSVTIEGVNGEKYFGNDEAIFNSPNLPDRIASVYFDTGSRHRGLNQNRNPLNWASVLLDFTKPPRFDLNNPVSSPTPNNSNIHVHGNDHSWVNTVFQTVMDLIEERRNDPIRGWIHNSHVYDILLWLVAMPLTFAVLNRASGNVEALGLPTIFSAAIYIYLFVVFTNLFRFFFSYTKWVWPKVQLEHPRDHSSAHRFWWAGVSASLIASLIYGVFLSGSG
jgi:hypothetical protein